MDGERGASGVVLARQKLIPDSASDGLRRGEPSMWSIWRLADAHGLGASLASASLKQWIGANLPRRVCCATNRSSSEEALIDYGSWFVDRPSQRRMRRARAVGTVLPCSR